MSKVYRMYSVVDGILSRCIYTAMHTIMLLVN